ncbi:MAG: polysaccharide biosynthesis/export family protein [Armatimonadota bacterium]
MALLFFLPQVLGLGALSVQAQQPEQYVLAAGDSVEITVFGEADLTRTITVRPDGKINMPLLGDIQAAGSSPAELAERITKALRTYLREPQVTVSVREFRRSYVQVVGQVSRPGSIEIQRGWTVLEVMGAAGGVTARAAMRRTTLTRRATGQIVAVNLEALLMRGDREHNLPVESGDVIMVPTLQNRVLLMGAVNRPGAYDIEEGARIFEVISAAGGPAERSAINNIGIIRVGPDGKTAVTTVDMTSFVRGDLKQNVPLRNEDVVYIPPDRSVRWADILSFLGPLSLIRALLGGF